jgi:rhodanese-related sulfurtransferase
MTPAVVVALGLIGWVAFDRFRNRGIARVNAGAVGEWAARPGAVVWDVRSPEEYRRGHIRGARNVPAEEISLRSGSLAEYRNRPVLLVCLVGARSGQAARILRRSGFTDVANLRGGMNAWIRKGFGVEKEK